MGHFVLFAIGKAARSSVPYWGLKGEWQEVVECYVWSIFDQVQYFTRSLHAADARLLGYSWRPELDDRDGFTALMHVDDCDYEDSTALMFAAGFGHAVNPALAQVNLCDQELGTPLISAASEGHAQVVQLLLAAGANPNLSGSYNSTSLMQAASNDHAPVVQLLLEAGAEVDARDYSLAAAIM
ncbi:unnamed protein product, partial [Symbiodinium sp. KB8]